MRDGVALLAILARVRRRLRTLAAVEGAVVAAALALGALALWFLLARWRAGAVPPPRLMLQRGLGGTLGFILSLVMSFVVCGGLLAALRRIPLERCARILDHTLAGHDRTLSALAFWRAGAGKGAGGGELTPFQAAAVADAVRRSATVAPGLVAPFRRPRGAPALGAAALLVALAGLVPLPARGSRVAAPSSSAAAAASPAAARVRVPGSALGAERDAVAAALRAAGTLDDPELARLARELASAVKDLSAGQLARGEALDRLADLQRRSDDAADELAALRQGLEQAGKALQGSAATHDSGRALEAQDAAATEKSLNELADKMARTMPRPDGDSEGPAGAAARNRIASALDKAGERARATDNRMGADTRPPGTSSPAAGAPPGAKGTDNAVLPGDDRAPEAGDDTRPEQQRRLARDNKPTASPAQTAAEAGARATHERRLQRLERELRETASACRADPESCRRKLQHQAKALPRMEDEARSLASRQRLAEAVRQLRERLRREGSAGGERAREEKRFMRSARGGDGARKGESTWDEEADGDARLYSEDADGMSGERDDIDGDGDGDDSSGGGPMAQSGGGDEAAAAAGPGPAAGGDGQENAAGQGIGNQRGSDPLGERGAMTTRGRAREAQVRSGAGPSRSQVIQSAARRGFAHTTYEGVYTDYQAAVEESLDASAVPPGRRYIVRRYFQLIRPQSPRAPR